jgi:hypothetical protein
MENIIMEKYQPLEDFVDGSFAKLYCKERKIEPELFTSRMDWGTLQIHVRYQEKGREAQTEEVEVRTAFDLLAKRILEVERHFVETQDSN